MKGVPWGLLAVIDEGGFLLDGTRSAMIESIRRQQSKGRCATAAVLPQGAEGRSIFAERLYLMYAEAEHPFALFSDETLARQWLEDQVKESQHPSS